MKAKKSLGQNFLKSQPALRKIIEAGELRAFENVLEIGPGKGALTEKLLEAGVKVFAVEKDKELFTYLSEKFKKEIKSGDLNLIQGDILKFSPKSYNLMPNSYKLIANIPYNITGAILKKFLSKEIQPSLMVLMIQHEVATRIIARDGKESILSVSVKAYGKPKLEMKVPARYFSPAPKVDSAVLSIKNISKDLFLSQKIDEKYFWELVKSGFAHKRKKLSSNLKKFLKKLPEETRKSLENKRAEQLSLEEWVALAKSTV